MIQDILNAAKSKFRRVSSNDLTALRMDIEYYLEQSQLFSKISSKKNSDDFPCLQFYCVVGNPRHPPNAIISKIRELWDAAPLGYQKTDFEESTVEGDLVLDFLTFSDSEFASGRISIRGLLNNPTGAA